MCHKISKFLANQCFNRLDIAHDLLLGIVILVQHLISLRSTGLIAKILVILEESAESPAERSHQKNFDRRQSKDIFSL